MLRHMVTIDDRASLSMVRWSATRYPTVFVIRHVPLTVFGRDGTGSGFLTRDPTRPGGFWPDDLARPDPIAERCETNPR